MGWISKEQLAPPPAQVIGWQQFSVSSAATAKTSSVHNKLPPAIIVPNDKPVNGASHVQRIRILDVLCGSSSTPQTNRRLSKMAGEASKRPTIGFSGSSPTFSQSSSDAISVWDAIKRLAVESPLPKVHLITHNPACLAQDSSAFPTHIDHPVLVPARATGVLDRVASVTSPQDYSSVCADTESLESPEELLVDISNSQVAAPPKFSSATSSFSKDPFDGIEYLTNRGTTSMESSPIENVSSATSLSSLPSPCDEPIAVDEKLDNDNGYNARATQLTDFGPSDLPTHGYRGPKELDFPFQHLFGNQHFEESSQLPEDLSYYSSPTAPSPLLELPGEVRCLVYRYLFSCGARVNLQRPGCWFYLFKQPIFYVNRQVRHETLTLLYHETYFEFDPIADATISSAFLLPYLQQIKHLNINCWQSNRGFLAGSILYFVGLGVELQTLEIRFMSSGVSVPKIFRKDGAVGKALAKVKVAERIVFHFGGKVGDHFGDTIAFRALKEALAPGKEWLRAVSIKRGFWMRKTQSTSWSVDL